MFPNLLARVAGSPLVRSVLSAIAVDSVLRVLNNLGQAAPVDENNQMLQDRASRQLRIGGFYTRFGLPGLKSLYDAGIISDAEWLHYFVKEQSYNYPAAAAEVIGQWESKVNGGFFSSNWPSLFGNSIDLKDLCSDPNAVAKAYNFLISKTRAQWT